LADQTRSHWVLFDVASNGFEFALLPHHMIVALFLPKGPSINANIALARLAAEPALGRDVF